VNISPSAIAAGGADEVAIGGGFFMGTVDFGGGPRTTPGTIPGGTDSLGFLVKLDGTGAYLYDLVFHPPSAQGPQANLLAMNAAGQVAFSGSYSVNAIPYLSQLLQMNGASAMPVWSKGYSAQLGGPAIDGLVIGIDAMGNVRVKDRTTSGTYDFGGGPMAHPLLAFDPTGKLVLSKDLPDVGAGFDAAGNTYLFGFPGQSVGCGPSNANFARFDAQGNCVASKVVFTGSGMPSWVNTAFDAAGDLILGAAFTTTLNVGCGTAANANAVSYLVAKLDSTGACVWQNIFTDPTFSLMGGQYFQAGVGAHGDVTFAGPFSGSIDFGGGPITPGAGVAIVSLDASGAFRWSRVMSTKSYAFAVSPLGHTYVVSPTVGFDLGTGPLLSGSGFVLVKLAP
jgi:hypothetical protein